VVNIIAQLPVSNNIAELPELGLGCQGIGLGDKGLDNINGFYVFKVITLPTGA